MRCTTKHSAAFLTLVLSLLFVLSSCDGSSTGPEEGEIGTEGGTATLAEGAVTLSVPSGALSNSLTFTATASTGGPADDGLVPGSTYNIGPSGTTFSQPVTVTIGYDEGSVPAGVPEGELRLFKAVGSSWQLQENSSVNTSANTVSGATTSLSLFAAKGLDVASVDVSPGSASLDVGGSTQFTATPRASDGTSLTRAVSWSSSATSIATVDDNGSVTAVSEGTATITATSEGQSGTATVTVADAVASVTVTPATSTLQPAETVQLSAAVQGATGNTLTRTVTWTTSNAAVATVDASGLTTAVGDGTATITATADGVNGTATVTVTTPVASVDVTPATADVNVQATVQLTATPRDAAGDPLTRTVTWTSSDELTATVDANGLVTGVAAGQVTITATAGEASAAVGLGSARADGPSLTASGTATITVKDPVTTVEVTPTTTSLTVGATVQLTATPKGVAGNEISGKTATWSSSDESKATVDASGLVTAVAAGSATITATIDGVQGTAQINVAFDVTAFEGDWTGSWTNTTFGSTGPAYLQVLLFTDLQEIEYTWDLDGNVFGATDPPADTYNGPYTDTGFTVTGTSGTFGTVSITGDTNGFTGSGTDVPAAGIDRVTFTGTFSSTAIHFDYVVYFTGGGTATGTIDLTKN